MRSAPARLLLPTALLLGFLSAAAGGGAPGDPAGAGSSPAVPADPCAAFSWDITRERALFSEVPQKLTAGVSAAYAPAMSSDRLYELSSAGLYRVALDQPFWVDVIAGGTAIPSRDFQGRPGCHAPHKVVEFELPAATPLTLQFSDGDAALLRVAVLQAPAQRGKT